MRATGSVVAGRYVLEDLLGEGGMAAVWAATHRVTGRSVALKFLSGDRANLEEARARFLREARAASLVQHPNVVPIHDVVALEDGTLMMVMDRLFGETLREFLEHRGRLLPEEAAAVLVPVLSAVGTAHAAGVVHRDLKPENIFITDDQGVRVLDFGIAKLMASEQQGNLTNTGALLGTPYYMAPEQIFGERDLDARADVWSLGVILYECLTGARPFEGENAGQIMKSVLTGRPTPVTAHVRDLPRDLVEALAAMLTTDRDLRAADLTRVFAVLTRLTPTEARSFGSAVAPRSLLPPSPSGSFPPPPVSARSTTPRSPQPAEHGPISAPDTQPSPHEAAAPALSDTLSTAGPQERTFRPEAAAVRPAVIAAVVILVGLAGYLAWPRGAERHQPSPVAAPPMPSAAVPTMASPTPPPLGSVPESPPPPAEASSSASPSAQAAPHPELPPPSRPKPPAPKAAPPPLPHNIQREIPF